MFPSMNHSSSYPLYYNQSPSFTTSLEANNISFQHQQELYSNFLMSSSIIPPISENPINTWLLEGPINLGNHMNIGPLDMNKQVFSSNKRANGKRDRHTKISTAQGVRDRRVRLSISIARDFFNLQDMLGFDKASKTLGWLLEKSKAAIEELTRTSNKANNNEPLFSSFDTNLVAQNIGDNGDNEDEVVDEEKDLASSRKQLGKRGNCNDQSLEKAIRRTRRAKARDRARERTKSKKTSNDQIDHNVHVQSFEGLSHHDQQQRVAEHNLMYHRPSISGSITPPTTLMIPHGMMMSKGVSVGETVVVKSKAKETLSLNYNNNNYDMITKDYDQMGYNSNFQHDHHNKYELLGNHNNGGIIQPSPGLSAMNIINLSTEICINAKSWDTNYSNQNLQ